MFTGIISDLGAVRSVEKRGDSRLFVATSYDMESVAIGASIACSGACLTVVDKGRDWFAVDASGETLARTTLGDWGPGTRVNLERPLKAGDELGGHLVLGHVDGVAGIVRREDVGDSARLGIAAPDGLARFIAEKGSVAVDGVSLTVNRVVGAEFEVNVIAHTLACTTLGAAEPGARANLEVDVLARYVARLNERGQP